MNVLIIHHLETIWAKGMKEIFDISIYEVADKIVDHIVSSAKNYHKIILTRFEGTELEDFHFDCGISEFINEVQEFAYGWAEEMFNPENKYIEFCDGGSHSEVVWLAPFLHKLKENKAEVDLCGAFDGECIEDMEIALKFLNIKYNRLENLIVG